MRLVTWPGRRQVQATTVVVLITVFVFAVYFGIVDYILTILQTSCTGTSRRSRGLNGGTRASRLWRNDRFVMGAIALLLREAAVIGE